MTNLFGNGRLPLVSSRSIRKIPHFARTFDEVEAHLVV